MVEMLTKLPPYRLMFDELQFVRVQNSLSYDVISLVVGKSEIGEQLVNFLTSLLEKNPLKRFQHGTEAMKMFKELGLHQF